MKIKPKLLLLLIGSTLPPLIISGVIVHQKSKKFTERQILERFEGFAAAQKNRVNSFADRSLERLALVVSRTQLRISLKNFIETQSPTSQKKMMKILIDAKKSIPDFLEINILDKEGKVLASTLPDNTNKPFVGTNLPKKDLSQYLLKLEYNKNQSRTLGFLLGPLFLDNEFLGLTVVNFDPTPLKEIITDYDGLGQTGETILAKRDTDGNALFLTSLRFDEKASLQRRVGKDKSLVPITSAMKKLDMSFTDAIDYRGVPVLAVSRYIPKMDWGLVVKIDKKEAFAPINQLNNFFGVMLFISTAITIWITIFLSGLISKPIMKVEQVAKQISSGHFEKRIENPSNDEIGNLGKAFNEMATKLLAAKYKLENRIEERTKELVETNKELKRSNSDLENFAYIASHDLQEPLRTVSSYTKLLKQQYEGKLDQDADEFINFAMDGASRMQSMIQDLLLYSRISTQAKKFNIFPSEEALKQSLNNLSVAIKETNASITYDSLPSVKGDVIQFEQVFQNLIGNALKFCSDGNPKVHISAQKKR